METLKPKRIKPLNFHNSGYYAIGLVVLTGLGFWQSFFSKYVDGTADFNAYFHFHGAMATIWILMLIIQPILIRKKKLELHKAIGKLSYLFLPLFFISVLLLKHHRLGGKVYEGLGADLWLQTKDIVIIGIMYFIAIKYKRNMQIHARAMIATGIVFIEPTLGRFLIGVVFPDSMIGFFATIGLMYLFLISLMVLERKQTSGRWIFPLEMGLYMMFHGMLLARISFPWWDSATAWFVKLQLT